MNYEQRYEVLKDYIDLCEGTLKMGTQAIDIIKNNEYNNLSYVSTLETDEEQLQKVTQLTVDLAHVAYALLDTLPVLISNLGETISDKKDHQKVKK